MLYLSIDVNFVMVIGRIKQHVDKLRTELKWVSVLPFHNMLEKGIWYGHVVSHVWSGQLLAAYPLLDVTDIIIERSEREVSFLTTLSSAKVK